MLDDKVATTAATNASFTYDNTFMIVSLSHSTSNNILLTCKSEWTYQDRLSPGCHHATAVGLPGL